MAACLDVILVYLRAEHTVEPMIRTNKRIDATFASQIACYRQEQLIWTIQ